MQRGIYILGNDKVIENVIALINSIRFYDADTPIIMIPYNSDYQKIEEIFTQFSHVSIFKNSDLIQDFANKVTQICGDNLLDRPNLFRKLLCWFGPFDEFIYIDTDIVVFDKIIQNLNYLQDYDFVCYDYQHRGGIYEVFNPAIQEDKIFTDSQLQDVFNSGFWISKKGIFSEENIWEVFQECANHPEYFYFPTADQTILNYLILKYIPRRFNIVRKLNKVPGNWAGTPHFHTQGKILFDPKINQPLQFVHWAGMRIEPGCAYFDIWEYYRNLNPSLPPAVFPMKPKPNQLQQTFQKMKSLFHFLKT